MTNALYHGYNGYDSYNICNSYNNMKGIQYRWQCNIHDKRVIDYNKRNQSQSHVSCDVCGSIDKTHARESVNNFIKSIENNVIVFNEKDIDVGKPKIVEITYYNSPKICGGC